MMMSDKIDQWTKGMIQFRKSLSQPNKDATNKFMGNSYVTLEGMLDAADNSIREIAEDNGIVYSQDVTSNTDSNIVSVTTLISHVSGQYVMYGPFNVPAGSKKDAQAYGSSTTYAKRYALAAALGIASDSDDDGNNASDVKNGKQKGTKKAPQNINKFKTISSNELNKLEDAVTSISDETNVDRKQLMNSLLKYLNASFPDENVTSLKGISIQCGERAMEYLDAVKKKYIKRMFGKSEGKQRA
ncbi:ERF family protein [Companilactobacillus kimchiensis]|uniref:Erf family protein n=1 Tax=Companilactobacillus kimchiensis TaxID=993692 RepID=A0A0R2LGC3_9LACO|nr:ERF family protein [Companilactobacillus kimchiensis]KRO00917.1 hypothetical protein IV57_GL000242 [Companilactobacillus kimchiensis]